MRQEETPRSQRAWAFRKLPPALPDPTEPHLPPEIKVRREVVRKEAQKRRQDEAHVQMVRADVVTRAWIEAGHDLRQPPEYRGVVFEYADNSGVHPSPFPPYRDEPQGSLTEAFEAFQDYSTTTPETHPEYFCVQCTVRHNARDGGRCGRCIGQDVPSEYPS